MTWERQTHWQADFYIDYIPLEQAEYVAHKDPLDQTKNLFKIPNGQPEARTLEYFKSVNSSTIQTLYQC